MPTPSPSTPRPPRPTRRRPDRQATRRTERTMAAAAQMLADDRCRPTHAEIGAALGVGKSAATRLLTRFAATLDDAERARWDAVGRRPKCRRMLVQGSVATEAM